MRVVVFVLAAISAALTPGLLSAQWPPYPMAGVPRTPDGKPDLNAPAPRTADGKPDFSGVWEYVRSRDGQPASSAATPSGATPSAGTSAGLGPAPAAGTSQFFNIGTGLKGGLPFQPWAAELRKQRAANNNKDNPDAHCLPLGLMQLHTHPQPRKIIQTPGVIVILYEANGGVRQIFTDGRPLPRNDPQPWWYGYSTAKWDGDTLVVETNGFRDDVWLDVEGSPMTSAGKMTERIRRPSYGYLETEITVDDPKAYTKPWTVKVNHRIMLDTDLIEFVCQENEKDAPHLTGK
jgi:hypothetical protein